MDRVTIFDHDTDVTAILLSGELPDDISHLCASIAIKKGFWDAELTEGQAHCFKQLCHILNEVFESMVEGLNIESLYEEVADSLILLADLAGYLGRPFNLTELIQLVDESEEFDDLLPVLEINTVMSKLRKQGFIDGDDLKRIGLSILSGRADIDIHQLPESILVKCRRNMARPNRFGLAQGGNAAYKQGDANVLTYSIVPRHVDGMLENASTPELMARLKEIGREMREQFKPLMGELYIIDEVKPNEDQNGQGDNQAPLETP